MPFSCLKNKINIENDKDTTIIKDIHILTIEDETYYKLLQDIRNGMKLSNEQNKYISKLPKENLLEIIKIYDSLVELLIIDY